MQVLLLPIQAPHPFLPATACACGRLSSAIRLPDLHAVHNPSSHCPEVLGLGSLCSGPDPSMSWAEHALAVLCIWQH
jgi:hypothetical protein